MSEPDSKIQEIIQTLKAILRRLEEEGLRQDSPWMTTGEVAAYTGFSPATIRDYVYKEVIPFTKPKGTGAVRFYRPAIDKWMSSYKRAGRETHKIKPKGL